MVASVEDSWHMESESITTVCKTNDNESYVDAFVHNDKCIVAMRSILKMQRPHFLGVFVFCGCFALRKAIDRSG